MKQKITLLMKSICLLGLALSLLLVVDGRPLQAAEPIKIGVVLSVTGRGGFLGTPEKMAITVVVDEVNRQGGLFGRPIELLFEDDQSNPTNSAIAATKLIRDKNVCSIIGASLVVGCMAVLPICEREGVVQLPMAPITIPHNKWVFCVPLTDYTLGLRMLKFTVDTLNAPKVALLHGTDRYGMMGAQGITEKYNEYGAELIITEKCEPTDTSMIPQLTKIKAARPDAILLYVNAVPAAVIAKNYKQLNMETIPVIGGGGIPTPEFIKLAGKVVEDGRWILFSPKDLYADKLPLDDPWRKDLYDPLMKLIKDKYGKTEWNGFYRNGYDNIRIVIEGLKIAGTDDRAALRDALEKVEYQGFLGNFKYFPTDHNGTQGEAFEPIMIKNGEYWPYQQ